MTILLIVNYDITRNKETEEALDLRGGRSGPPFFHLAFQLKNYRLDPFGFVFQVNAVVDITGNPVVLFRFFQFRDRVKDPGQQLLSHGQAPIGAAVPQLNNS